MRANHIHSVQKEPWAWHSYITYQGNPIDMPPGKTDVGNSSIEVLLLDDSRLYQIDRHSSHIASLFTLEPYPFPVLYGMFVRKKTYTIIILILVYLV